MLTLLPLPQVLTGHVHSYERSYPQYQYSLDPCGVAYIVVGEGGGGRPASGRPRGRRPAGAPAECRAPCKPAPMFPVPQGMAATPRVLNFTTSTSTLRPGAPTRACTPSPTTSPPIRARPSSRFTRTAASAHPGSLWSRPSGIRPLGTVRAFRLSVVRVYADRASWPAWRLVPLGFPGHAWPRAQPSVAACRGAGLLVVRSGREAEWSWRRSRGGEAEAVDEVALTRNPDCGGGGGAGGGGSGSGGDAAAGGSGAALGGTVAQY